jgi:single-strand DNA-binding protein
MKTLNNSVRLLGNVGMDPEVISFESGNKLAKFSLATNERRKSKEKDGYENITTWHNLVIWGKGADIIETYIKKGAQLAVEGKLTYNKYTDKDGNSRVATEILVNDFTMLGGKSESTSVKPKATKKDKSPLPF